MASPWWLQEGWRRASRSHWAYYQSVSTASGKASGKTGMQMLKCISPLWPTSLKEYLNKSTELLIERFSADLDRLEECSPTTSDLTSFPLSDEGNVALDFWSRTCYLNEVWGATRSLFHLQRIEGGKNCAEWHALLAKLGKRIQPNVDFISLLKLHFVAQTCH